MKVNKIRSQAISHRINYYNPDPKDQTNLKEIKEDVLMKIKQRNKELLK